MNLLHLPRGAGTAIFPGGGAWLPRHDPGLRRGDPPQDGAADPAIVLNRPERVLVADHPADIVELLNEVEGAQQRGCWVAGYLGYEAGAAFGLTVRHAAVEPLPAGALACNSVPLAWMAVYRPEAVRVMPLTEWSLRLRAFTAGVTAARLSSLKLRLNVSEEHYTRAIARVRDYIAAGDTYQVNYTVRARYDLRTPDGGSLDPLDYFLALVARQPVLYAAYLDLGPSQVLSLSPELFLRQDGDLLESRPMKGTRPRGATHAADVALAYELAETEKERAENLMILDMVRNDLGRVSRTGTVRVPALYTVEPYRTVWQMTSVVQGRLQPGTSLLQIMKAVFPGASITGAPKHHTMEIISEMESEPRGVYTGTVALFAPGGDFTGNIGIRTIVHRDGRCVLGVGSGIVWDARAPAEYEETLAKAAFALVPRGGARRPPGAGDESPPGPGEGSPGSDRPPAERRRHHEPALRLFETILLESGRSYRYLEEHLARMAASARALGFRFDRQAAEAMLAATAAAGGAPFVVRLELRPDGRFELSIREAPAVLSAPVRLLVSPFRIDIDDPFLAHKTTRRGFYDREHRRALAAGCFDALFLNRLDRVTEGGISNIFARFGSRWATPPLGDGLLPGIWRAAFLAARETEERSFGLDDLRAADEIVIGNSVRGAIPVAGLWADPLTY